MLRIRQVVFHLQRHFGEDRAGQQAVFLQTPERLRQHLLRHVRQVTLHLPVPLRALAEDVKDDGRPLVPDQVEQAAGVALSDSFLKPLLGGGVHRP